MTIEQLSCRTCTATPRPLVERAATHSGAGAVGLGLQQRPQLAHRAQRAEVARSPPPGPSPSPRRRSARPDRAPWPRSPASSSDCRACRAPPWRDGAPCGRRSSSISTIACRAGYRRRQLRTADQLDAAAHRPHGGIVACGRDRARWRRSTVPSTIAMRDQMLHADVGHRRGCRRCACGRRGMVMTMRLRVVGRDAVLGDQRRGGVEHRLDRRADAPFLDRGLHDLEARAELLDEHGRLWLLSRRRRRNCPGRQTDRRRRSCRPPPSSRRRRRCARPCRRSRTPSRRVRCRGTSTGQPDACCTA